MRIRHSGTLAVARKFKEILVGGTGAPFIGLNTTSPYTQLRDGESPYEYNARLYARNSTDRRVAVRTRKGPGFYSVPLGETVDQQQTSITGASTQSMTTTTWLAKKFTAGISGALDRVDLNLKQGISPTQHNMVAIYSDSAGSPGTLLATSSILSSSITTTATYLSCYFIEALSVTAATAYWVVSYMQAGGSGTQLWTSTTNAATAKTSSNSGGTWSTTTFDLNVKTYVATNSKYLGGFRYTPSNATAKTIEAHGSNVYTVNDVNGVTTSIKSGLSSSATEYNFAQSNDILYAANNFDAPQQYDGTTWSAVAGAPPTSQLIIFHKNRLFVVDKTNPTKIVFSELSDYVTYLSTNFIYAPSPKSGDPITSLHVFQDNLTIFTRKTKYTLFGDDPGNFVLRQSSGKKGAVNNASVKSDPNYIYFLADDGVYRYNGSSDDLVSDKVQNEIASIGVKTAAAAVVHNNYYRLYYPSTGQTVNNTTLLWDTINSFWLRDSNTYIDKPFLTETDQLIEGSSKMGAIFFAEQAYSDLGKPIDFIYYTKYFGDGLRKMFMRRIIPSIRLQTQPYLLNIYVDLEQRDSNSLSYSMSALASGLTWGSTSTWGGGSTTTWGSSTVSTPTVLRGSEAYWQQIRFVKSGVDTPVEILSYLIQLRVRRTE